MVFRRAAKKIGQVRPFGSAGENRFDEIQSISSEPKQADRLFEF
jgi:hypothetical protein